MFVMFKKILIGSDGSGDALHAAHLAALIARASHSEIIVVNSFNMAAALAFLTPDAMACSETIIDSGKEGQKETLKGTSDFLAVEGVSCRTRAEIGHPVEVTLRVAAEEKADLIVLGNRGLHGFEEALLGSVSEGVVLHAHCPVLISRGKALQIRQILVAVDGSELSYKALQAAGEIAKPLKSKIVVLNVLDSAKPFPGFEPDDILTADYALRVRNRVLERMDEELKETGIEYRLCQETGHPAEVIATFAAANDADLIVVGSHGLGVFQRALLGSVSDAVLHHTERPILIVR
jgi:hypothetical protein